MDCTHSWIEKITPPLPDGGYMIIKICKDCLASEGYGFLDKDHEVNYLNKLIDISPGDMLK
jgi:hypothetical protein